MNARAHLFAALLGVGSLGALALPAAAQDYAVTAGPVINGFNVDNVRRLDPGTELNFDLYGSPGGRATLRIDGATRNLHMTEVEPGQYQGTYTIGVHDRIRPGSGVTANLRVGNRVATSALGEPLLADRTVRPVHRRGELAALPRIDGFHVQAADDLGPGNDLVFDLHGTPGAKVEVTIAGSRGIFFLPEVRPGEYRASYRIRRTDHIAPDASVTATIRANGRYATAALGQPLLAAGAPRVARYCTNCATVEAVNVVEVTGDGSYLGTVGGALVGGLVGSQVGSGSGRTAAEVAGAVGGAVAGRNIERNAHRRLRYEVVLRYANGATQTIPYENDPGFHAGDKVKVNNGVLSRDY